MQMLLEEFGKSLLISLDIVHCFYCLKYSYLLLDFFSKPLCVLVVAGCVHVAAPHCAVSIMGVREPDLPFKVGQQVESRSFQVGFRGAWFKSEVWSDNLCTKVDCYISLISNVLSLSLPIYFL